MKKLILPLLLAATFLFAGFEKANAATASKITFTSVVSPTGNPVQYGQTGVALYELQATTNNYTTGTSNVTGLTLNSAATGQTISNYFSTANIQLWYSTTANLTGGTQTKLAATGFMSSTVSSSGTTLSFAGFTQSIGANKIGYFYVLVNYDNSAGSTPTSFELDGTNNAASIVTSSTNAYNSLTGTAYNLVNGVVTLTSVGGNNASASTSNNLFPITVNAAQTGAIYGFSLSNSSTTTAQTITELYFNSNPATYSNSSYFPQFTLVSCTSPSYSAMNSTVVASSTGMNPVFSSASIETMDFTGLNISVPAGGALSYYFIVVTYSTPVLATCNFEMDFQYATIGGNSTLVAANQANTGVHYTFTVPAVTITNVPAAGGNTPNTTNLVVAEFSAAVTNNRGAYLYTCNFTSTGASAPSLTTSQFTIWEILVTTGSPAPTFSTGAALSLQTINAPTTTPNANLSFNNIGGYGGGNGTTAYYFITENFTVPNTTGNESFALVTNSTWTQNNNAAITPSYATSTYPGGVFTWTVPVVSDANIASNYLTNGTIFIGQKGIAVAGISLNTTATGASGTVSKFVLAFSQTAAIAGYLTNYKVYSTTTAPTAPFTAIPPTTPYTPYTAVGATITPNSPSAGYVTVALTTAQPISNTPTYFYIVGDYTVLANSVPQTFTFNFSSYTYNVPATGTAMTNNTSYTANTFTCTQPTYYYNGPSTGNWETAANWEVGTGGVYTLPNGNGYYPGQIYSILGYSSTTPDNVDISPFNNSLTIGLSSTLNVGYIYFEPGNNTTLNIAGSNTLSTGYFLEGSNTGGGSNAIVNLNASGTGTFLITANAFSVSPSAIAYPGTFNVKGGIFSLGNSSYSGTQLNLFGGNSTANSANLNLTGGTIYANDSEFYLFYGYASITASSGTTINAVNNTYLIMNNGNESIINNGANITFDASGYFNTNSASDAITNNSGNFTLSGGTNATVNGPTTVNGGIFALTGSTYSLSGGSANFNVKSGGTANITASSTFNVNNSGSYYNNYSGGTTTVDNSNINLANGSTALTNAGTFSTTGGTVITYNANTGSILSNTGTFSTLNTTINFNKASCQLNNTAGSFNFGSGSVMNLSSKLGTVTNSGSGTFTCGPTSVINLPWTGTGNAAQNAANAPTVTNSGSGIFTLLSDTTGSATIGNIATIATNGSFIGQFNVQRFISRASRGYRVLSSPVNKTQANPGNAGSPNVVDISALGKQVTSPANYYGAYIAGPGSGFPNQITNPILYLYQESILPGASVNKSYTSGKNVGIIDIATASPWGVSTQSQAAAGTTSADNNTAKGVVIPAGNGYLLYYIHDDESSNVSAPLTISTTTATGYINQGSIPFILWGIPGSLTPNLTYTTTSGQINPGVTMVGNPYPASIDLQALYNDNDAAGNIFTAGQTAKFYELNPTTNNFDGYNYSSYNGGTVTTSGLNPSQYIASGQGFYVTVYNTKNGKTLTFNEDQKVPSTTGPTGTTESIRTGPGVITNKVSTPSSISTDAVSLTGANATSIDANKKALDRLKKISLHGVNNVSALSVDIHKSDSLKDSSITRPNAVLKLDSVVTKPANKLAGLHLKLVQDSLNYDECGVYFDKQFSDNFDNDDSKDMDGTSGKVFLSSYSADDVRTCINTLGDYKGGKRVKLYVRYSTAGIFKLQLEDIANISNKYSVFLIDNLNKDSLDLTLYKSYNFNYGPGTANDSTRFVLAIEHKPVPHYALLTFAGQKVTPGVQLNWQTTNLGDSITFVLQKLSAGNVYVSIDSLQSATSGEFNYIDQHPTLGNNTYRLEQINGLGTITYSAPVTIGYNSTNPNGGLVLYPNPAKSTMTVTLTTSSTAVQVATADIYNAQGKLIEHKVVNSNSFVHDVSAYDLGVYIIELKNSNGVLVGNSKFVKVN